MSYYPDGQKRAKTNAATIPYYHPKIISDTCPITLFEGGLFAPCPAKFLCTLLSTFKSDPGFLNAVADEASLIGVPMEGVVSCFGVPMRCNWENEGSRDVSMSFNDDADDSRVDSGIGENDVVLAAVPKTCSASCAS